MARARGDRTAMLLAIWARLLRLVWGAPPTTMFFVVNKSPKLVRIIRPVGFEVAAGASWAGPLAQIDQWLLESPGWKKVAPLKVDKGRYAAVLVDAQGEVSTQDANGVQLELSAAAHACKHVRAEGEEQWSKCMAERVYGGIRERPAVEAFRNLWNSYDYWWLCEAADPSPSIREITLESGIKAQVLREEPLVAAARGFLNASVCEGLMGMLGKDELTRAHVGAGGGATATSDARETLTKNMFVDWGSPNLLAATSARTFDVASELLGEKIPYEGQEPVNFLHYLLGFEYKPHTDGAAERLGKRVATTLVYCEAAASGGATVFPIAEESKQVRFVPRAGDLLFFQYAPRPSDALHAACPVVSGRKSTLTQWHRLGVSIDKPWDNFEDWGVFHNPHGKSRWGGPRYSTKTQPPRKEL